MTIDARSLKKMIVEIEGLDAELVAICKDATTSIIGSLEEEAIICLENWENIRPRWSDRYSRNELEEALDVMRAARQGLAGDSFDLDLLDGQLYDRQLRLIFAVITVTAAITLVYASHKQKLHQVAYARERRSQRPEKVILQAAIKQLHGDSPSARPYKDAAAILDPVNRRLQSLGYEPVTVDAIALRLKKFPSS
jgi:hypothetical protein